MAGNEVGRYRSTTCGEHSRNGRRYASKFYDVERMDQLRAAQGLYGEDETEADALKVRSAL